MGGEITVGSVYGEGTTFTFHVICPGGREGFLAEVKTPEAISVLVYESNAYNAGGMDFMLHDLGVTYLVCNDIGETREAFLQGSFTHFFFDKSSKEDFRDIFESKSLETENETGTSCKFILLKEILEKYDKEVPNAVNRPVLITNLADVLNRKKTYEQRSSNEHDTLSFKNVFILVVDDNQVNRMVAEGLLLRYGAVVDTVSSGKDAIAAVKKNIYDLVFMDHMMPGMDGLEATKTIRALGGRFENLTIIALSANAMSGARELFISAGMNDFLSKPIIIKDLKEILVKYLPPEKMSF
jgi:CheY-like chemotaxis protein